MDIKLLKTVLQWQAESHNVAQQRAIFEEVTKLLPRGCTVTYDSYGNMYITKGTADVYPCYAAHVDQVHKYCDNFTVLRTGDFFHAFDGARGQQVGVGGDDKCGVYLCIQALKKFPACKVALFKDEEVGCVGSGKADLAFFSDVAFIVQGDRRHNKNDCINYTNGVSTSSAEFDAAAAPILKEFGYAFADGSCTDIGELVKRGVGCVALNLASGYFNAHSATEVVSISKLELCENFAYALFENLGHQRWAHVGKSKYASQYGDGWYNQYPKKGKKPAGHLPAAQDCQLCASPMTTTHGEHYCGSCGLYKSDIEFWIDEMKKHAEHSTI
jgi:putative aminopeptidase FrvX